MKLLLFAILFLSSNCLAADSVKEYDVDYEEDLPPTPVSSPQETATAETESKAKKKKIRSSGQFEGTRSQNKFDPAQINPGQKSIYKKNGIPLDVDTD